MPNPHDKLFKAIFSEPASAAEHFEAVLPATLTQALDLPRIQHVPGSFVDAAFRERHADLLFSVPFRSAEGMPARRGRGRRRSEPAEALIYVLFEHQSREDPLMPLRILGYMLRIWDRWLADRRGRRLPPILPLVLYQGRSPWRSSRQFADLVWMPESVRGALSRYVPAFEFLLEAIAHMPEAALPGGGLPRLTLMLLRADDDDAILGAFTQMLDAVAEAAAGDAPSLQRTKTLLRYALTILQGRFEELVELLGARSEHTREIAVTLREQFIQEGLERGRRDAAVRIARNLLDDGVPVEKVAQIVGLPVAEVKQLAK